MILPDGTELDIPEGIVVVRRDDGWRLTAALPDGTLRGMRVAYGREDESAAIRNVVDWLVVQIEKSKCRLGLNPPGYYSPFAGAA